MTWTGDSQYGLPEPERPEMDPTTKTVLAGTVVLFGICFVIVLSMMLGGGGGKADEAVAAPVAPPPVPEPIPTVTVTATPEPAPTVYVTQPPAPVTVQEVPQSVPLAPAGPSEEDTKRNRANCYDALASSANLPPQTRWTQPCRDGFPNTDPGQFMFREQPFAQRLRAMAPRDYAMLEPQMLFDLGWSTCGASQRSEIDRGQLARELGRKSYSSSTSDFSILVNAALDALCPEAEFKPGADNGYSSGGYRSGYGA